MKECVCLRYVLNIRREGTGGGGSARVGFNRPTANTIWPIKVAVPPLPNEEGRAQSHVVLLKRSEAISLRISERATRSRQPRYQV